MREGGNGGGRREGDKNREKLEEMDKIWISTDIRTVG